MLVTKQARIGLLQHLISWYLTLESPVAHWRAFGRVSQQRNNQRRHLLMTSHNHPLLKLLFRPNIYRCLLARRNDGNVESVARGFPENILYHCLNKLILFFFIAVSVRFYRLMWNIFQSYRTFSSLPLHSLSPRTLPHSVLPRCPTLSFYLFIFKNFKQWQLKH